MPVASMDRPTPMSATLAVWQMDPLKCVLGGRVRFLLPANPGLEIKTAPQEALRCSTVTQVSGLLTHPVVSAITAHLLHYMIQTDAA
jgi:hypothetical protein